MGCTTYIPLYVQGVLGGSVTLSGLAATPLSIGWPIATFLIGPRLVRWGFRKAALIGLVLITVSSAMLVLTTTIGSVWYPMVVLFFMGVGMGLSVLSFLVAVQSSVTWQQRGVATGVLQFIRSLGSTVGVAVMGTVMNTMLVTKLLEQRHLDAPLDTANSLLDIDKRGSLEPEMLQLLTCAFENGLHQAFLVLAVFGALGLIVTRFFPLSRTSNTQEIRNPSM